MSITDLRANLALYLAKAKAGESVVITERGKPIAKLGPATESAWIADLQERGIISPPLDPDGPWPTAEPPEIGEGAWQLSDMVTDQRD